MHAAQAFEGIALGLSTCVVSCAPALPRSLPLREPSPVAAVDGDLSSLQSSVRGPARLDYNPQSLGPVGSFVSIRLQNVGQRAVALGRLHASFEATRDGVAFGCNSHVDRREGAIEPTQLAPSQAFTFERLLDCAMPLPGRYDVRVWMHPGDREDSRTFVGSLQVDVEGKDGNVPRPVPPRAGLYALMMGAPAVRPMTEVEWTQCSYRVVLALVNGGHDVVRVGPAYLAVLEFRRGTPVPCAGRRQQVDEPAVLAPGAIHLVRVPVACAPTREGQYDLVGRFALDGGQEIEIGRVGLLVTETLNYVFSTPEPARP